MKSDFFQLLEPRKTQIIKNKEVLSHTWIPSELPHRDVQIAEVIKTIRDALYGIPPPNVIIYGKTGTAKTVVILKVFQLLREKAQEKKNMNDFDLIYINCNQFRSEVRIIAELVEQLNTGMRAPRSGWSKDSYINLLSTAMKNRKIVVIALDEIDKVQDCDDLLYDFSRAKTTFLKSSTASISIIGISNDLTFFERLGARSRSSLLQREIIFPPYTANQLQDILEQRKSLAFYPDTLDNDVIPTCAALSAREHGDARKAIDLLKVAGEITEELGMERVTQKEVYLAQSRIDVNVVSETVKTLPTQAKLVLYTIIYNDERNIKIRPTTGDIYNLYKEICRFMKYPVLTQRRVSDILAELDMLGVINARTKSYGRGMGRTKEITLISPSIEIKKAIFEDNFLDGLRLLSQKTGGKQLTLNV